MEVGVGATGSTTAGGAAATGSGWATGVTAIGAVVATAGAVARAALVGLAAGRAAAVAFGAETLRLGATDFFLTTGSAATDVLSTGVTGSAATGASVGSEGGVAV
ncbi:MAG: hypothetical protein ABIW03_03400 [Sphingomicrobium sp.]